MKPLSQRMRSLLCTGQWGGLVEVHNGSAASTAEALRRRGLLRDPRIIHVGGDSVAVYALTPEGIDTMWRIIDGRRCYDPI